MSNPLCHFELMVADPSRTRAFYGKVFNWTFDDDAMPGYTLIDTGREPTGAILPKPPNAPRACANIYFQSDDINHTLALVTESGGKVLIPKTEIPSVGYFAMFADPDGIPVGIMTPTV